MKTNRANRLLLVICAALFAAPPGARAGGGHDHSHDHGHGHGHDHHEAEPARGEHGGRLLTEGDLSLELSIFESGVPPRFRLYALHDGKRIPPEELAATVRLSRFGGKTEEFVLGPEKDYLSSPKTVSEPHSFGVEVSARFEGKDYRWEFESHEGRTELSDEALKIADLGIETAGPAELLDSTRVYGRLLANEDRVAHLTPRFPGVIREIRKELGDSVAKGETIAVIESNQSLQPYDLRSQVAGTVIKRHATVGEFVSDSVELFVIADLSEVWADFQIYRDDHGPIAAGQQITIELGSQRTIPARIKYVSPITDERTQSKLVRAVLPNPSGELRPGLFVSGALSNAQATVPLAVRREALQTFRDWTVVYLTDGHAFQAVPVTVGRRDAQHAEILSGLSPGDRYVARNSFIIKADVEKAGASHDH